MAKEKEKKFFWLKLKDSFMTSDTVDFLMSQKNGSEYVVLYQMLILKTINTQGELVRKIGEVIIPFDIDKIQRDCKWFEYDTVVVALELYKKLGLVYQQEDGIFKITNFENLVGSETHWAEIKRIEREKQKKLEELEKEKINKLGQSPKKVQLPLISSVFNLESENIDINNIKEEFNNIPLEVKNETIKTEVITIPINSIIDSIRKTYKDKDYSNKFHKTATTKKLKTILTAKDKTKKLYPLQIVCAYRLYIGEQYDKDTEVDFIKGSEVFLSDSVYDYADRCNTVFEAEMVKKYSADWQKVKFEYIES